MKRKRNGGNQKRKRWRKEAKENENEAQDQANNTSKSHPAGAASMKSSLTSTSTQNPRYHCEFTIKAPQFSYAHLQLAVDGVISHSGSNFNQPLVKLEELLVKSYCTNALRQHLGLTGAAVPLDILKVTDAECWLRVPREDLTSLAAALAAFPGAVDNGTAYLLRIRQCSDWLGTIVCGSWEDRLWRQ